MNLSLLQVVAITDYVFLEDKNTGHYFQEKEAGVYPIF